jgi:thioredoxin 1
MVYTFLIKKAWRAPDAVYTSAMLAASCVSSIFLRYAICMKEERMAEAVTSATWEQEVLKATDLVLVDFWAVWCGPCRMVAPIVDEISKEYAGKLKVVKLNTDENPDVAGKYRIMGIPTLMFFKNGQTIDQVVGAVPKAQLKAKVDALLEK